MDPRTIRHLDRLGVDMFRLNLSHTDLEILRDQIQRIRRHSRQVICLDTEGAQVRTGVLGSERVLLKQNSILRIRREKITGNSTEMNLYPLEICDQLIEGDLLQLDFGSAVVQVTRSGEDRVETRVLAEGYISRNKAVVVDREISMPALTEKDRKAIEIGLVEGIEFVALSFAGSRADVESARLLLPPEVGLISKIESVRGLEHLDEIMAASQAILIDRGDLSREVPMEAIPFVQKRVIQEGKLFGIPVYVATNLLESMVTNLQPTRAEVSDVINILSDGADGLVLAAETAVGAHPVACANMIIRLVRFYDERVSQNPEILPSGQDYDHWLTSIIAVDDRHRAKNSLYPEDHDNLGVLPSIPVDESTLMDVEQIGIGTFAPLTGFMTEEALNTVLEDYRMPDGSIWTIPVLLPVAEGTANRLQVGEDVALVSNVDSKIYGMMTVADIFTQETSRLAMRLYGTDHPSHPGVSKMLEGSNCFVGGPIKLVRRRSSPFAGYELTPDQIRKLFEARGWTTVVGFHTRNVAHRAHEKLMRLALERTGADGLLISPVLGSKKSGDFDSSAILRTYELLLQREFLPLNQALLAGFATYSRYAGPREAVFTALCRRNLGCTHFIVGRDHTGVGNFYRPTQAQELFEELGDIGIEPVFFDELAYCPSCGDHVQACPHLLSDGVTETQISGTKVRDLLRNGQHPPEWMMRTEVAEILLKDLNQGKDVFVG